jgi:hypothetical protein
LHGIPLCLLNGGGKLIIVSRHVLVLFLLVDRAEWALMDHRQMFLHGTEQCFSAA